MLPCPTWYDGLLAKYRYRIPTEAGSRTVLAKWSPLMPRLTDEIRPLFSNVYSADACVITSRNPAPAHGVKNRKLPDGRPAGQSSS